MRAKYGHRLWLVQLSVSADHTQVIYIKSAFDQIISFQNMNFVNTPLDIKWYSPLDIKKICMLSIWIICLFSMFTKSGKLDFFCSSMVLGQSFVKFERIYWIVLGFDMKRMPLLFLLPLLHFHSFSLYYVLFALPSHLPFLSPFPIPFPPDYLSPFPSPFLFPPLLCPLSLFPFPLSRFPIPCPPHSLSSHIYMCALNKIVKCLIIRITVISTDGIYIICFHFRKFKNV